MIRRPPRSTPLYSSAASDVYKRQTPGIGINSFLEITPPLHSAILVQLFSCNPRAGAVHCRLLPMCPPRSDPITTSVRRIKMPQTKFLLDESEIPTHWYNVVADMPNPPTPPL